MKQLYMIHLGGKAPGANVEVHDVQFVIAETIEEVLPILRADWYGLALKLHLDAYKVIKHVDGYSIDLIEEGPKEDKQVYFGHLGGYIPTIGEVHDVRLVVEDDLKKAKARLASDKTFDHVQRHVDNVVPLNDIVKSSDGISYTIGLKQTGMSEESRPDWFGYRRIDQ